MQHIHIMNRQEHLQWCKQRAFEYIDAGDRIGAWQSFCSDLRKHEGTDGHPAVGLGMALMLTGGLQTLAEMRKFISDSN